MARNSTRVCKSTEKNSSATRIRMASSGTLWNTTERGLDTTEQDQTRLNTSDCPDAVWTPTDTVEQLGTTKTLQDGVGYHWTLLDSVEHLGHGPDRIGHARTLWHNWAPLDSGGQCRTLVDTVSDTVGHSRAPLDTEWTVPDTVGWRDTAEY